MFWPRFIYIILISVLLSQDQNSELPPDKGVEFRLNSLSGIVRDDATKKPVEDVNIELYTGNKVLKHSLLSNEDGLFSRQNIGYLWKPRVVLDLENYRTKTVPLLPESLDSTGSIYVEYFIEPLPENERVVKLARNTLTKRAETFFIAGNLFYYFANKRSAKKVIIREAKAIQTKDNHILMNVNGKEYDVSKCYVPQSGRYENLSFILKSLLSEPLFKNSGLPLSLIHI